MLVQLKSISILIKTRFLELFLTIFLGEEKIKLFNTLDWQKEITRFQNSDFSYPCYYEKSNFHGIEGGYLNPIAALTYDLVIAFATPPHETWIRQKLINQIKGQPQRILDLGCGTGSTTLMLKQAFSQATVIGLDLSPYMLVMANYKAVKLDLKIEWLQGLAEATQLEDNSFDLVTVSFLFHETPVHITELILEETFRILKSKGQIIILAGHQHKLRHANWLTKLFREPYSQVYAKGNMNQWLSNANFSNIHTQAIGWINQLTTAIKI